MTCSVICLEACLVEVRSGLVDLEVGDESKGVRIVYIHSSMYNFLTISEFFFGGVDLYNKFDI